MLSVNCHLTHTVRLCARTFVTPLYLGIRARTVHCALHGGGVTSSIRARKHLLENERQLQIDFVIRIKVRKQTRTLIVIRFND